MRIAPIVMRIREAQTRFGNYVAGSAELELAIKNTLKKDVAFVVPVNEDAATNNTDSAITQSIIERFAVIVALANDTTDKDKTGLSAYDLLHDIRSQLFRSILGWQIKGAESLIYYAGGKFLTIQNDYLWWQYDFEFKSRLTEYDGYCDITDADRIGEGEFETKKQISQLDDFNKIHTDYILWPSDTLTWTGDIPTTGGIDNMETWIDLTDNPDDGSYGRGFGSEFDFYRVLNRKNDPK
jgi:hypothetical protein